MTIQIEKNTNNYGAYVPDLSGCVAVGETKDEVIQLIHEVIELHLESLHQDGLPIPELATTSELVEV